MPNCHSNEKKSTFKCATLGQSEVQRFYDRFYKNESKQAQDCFLLKYIQQQPPKKRQKDSEKRKAAVSTTYFVPNTNGKLMKVCQKAFLNILKVSKDRVRRIGLHHFLNGEAPKERRGGDRRSYKFADKKLNVKKFIERLRCVESHYCRGKSTRVYLHSDCSIHKLWKLYNEQSDVQLEVKYEYFRDIFNTDYNISFKTPKTDACSTVSNYAAIFKITGRSNKV